MSEIDDSRKGAEDAISALAESGRPVVGHFGSVEIEGKQRWWFSIRYDEAVEKLVDNPERIVAQVLAALGSEVRLSILRTLLDTPKTAAQIIGIAGLKTTGQVYHHLRELELAGFVKQRSGGRYQIDMNRGRIYLAALALAADAGSEQSDEFEDDAR